MHGQVYARPWNEIDHGRYAIVGPFDDYPWPYRVEHQLVLDGARLEWTIALTNESGEDAPVGLGIHPWWRAGDGFELRVPAESVFALPADELCGPLPIPVDGALFSNDQRAIVAISREHLFEKPLVRTAKTMSK